MAPPAGPAGGQTAYECDGGVPRWRLGGAYGWTQTDLRIGGDRVDVTQHTASLSLTRALKNRWRIGGSLGVLVGGRLRWRGRRDVISPGGAASLSASREWLDDWRHQTFLTTSAAFAFTAAPTRSEFDEPGTYTAVDFSVAVAVGKTLWNVWSPYLSARAFGGPVWWDATGPAPGQDPDHYSLGVGSVFSIHRNLELGIDWAAAGARGLTAQLGINF